MMKSILVVFLSLLFGMAIAQNDLKKPTLQDYLKLAEQNKNAGDIKEATRFLNEAATLVWEEKKYTEAITYFNQSIELNKQIENESGISKIQSNLGMIYADMAQYENSLDWFSKSLAYREKSGTKPEVISCRINISVVLNNLKKFNEAAQNLEVALDLATQMNDAQQMKACYGMLAETYEQAGNAERTTHYFNLYRTFTDMIARTSVKAARQETEQAQLLAMQIELEKKEKEILLLKTSAVLKQTEEQLTEISTEANSLISNNTKQELAMSLLEREAELKILRLAGSEAKANRQRFIFSGITAALIIAILFSMFIIRNAKRRVVLKKQLAEMEREMATFHQELEGQTHWTAPEIKNLASRFFQGNWQPASK